MKLEWQQHPESEIYGNWVLVDNKGKRLLDYALWDTCVNDMFNNGIVKRQAILNGLMDMVTPFISKEIQDKQLKLKSKEVFELFESKISELTDAYFEILAKKNEVQPKLIAKTDDLLITPEDEIFLPTIKTTSSHRKHSHYFKPCPYDSIDVYRVLKMFEVTDQALGHAIKKLLVAGGRGVKDTSKDIQEAIDTLQRKLEMDLEDKQ
jgi:hypothetical protein